MQAMNKGRLWSPQSIIEDHVLTSVRNDKASKVFSSGHELC